MAIMLFSCEKDLYSDQIKDEQTSSKEDLIERKSRCQTDKRMVQLYLNRVGYLNEIKDGRVREMLNLEKNTSRSAAELPILTIPVHIVVVHRPGHLIGKQTNISDERIHSQIATLNNDFLRRNADAGKTPASFNVSGSQIQFCLASVDAKGQPTNGVTRYASNLNFDDNELSIKGSTGWDPRRYLNIWVAPDIDGLGYAYLPSPASLPQEDEDGVVILTEAFGGPNSGAEFPFNLGRTTTHEVGHYLGLDHIWGEGCQSDDGISDTPDQAEENYECPSHPSPSCGNKGDMFMNYMDYTDDECMNAFSTGQNLYMRQILTTSRAELIQPGRVDCRTDDTVGIVNATCNDGIKNGTETAIDCGGSCKPCAVSHAPDAGIINITYTTEVVNCGQSVLLKPSLMNYSTSNLRQATIEVKSGAAVLLTHEWSGTLQSNAQTVVTLPRLTLSGGSNQITIRTVFPNGQVDSNPGNDAQNIKLNIDGNTKYELLIQPDAYASDISWKVLDDGGSTVASGSNYKDSDRTMIRTTMCLPAGCYRLVMKDSYGDGICCDYGKGWYELRDPQGRAILQSDGYYGYRETQSFCLDSDNHLARQQIDRDPRVISSSRIGTSKIDFQVDKK